MFAAVWAPGAAAGELRSRLAFFSGEFDVKIGDIESTRSSFRCSIPFFTGTNGVEVSIWSPTEKKTAE